MKKFKIIFTSLLLILSATFASADPIEVTIRNYSTTEYIAIGKFPNQGKKQEIAPGETKTYTLDDSYDYAVSFGYDPKTLQGMDAVLLDSFLGNAFLECGYEDGNIPVVYVTYRYSLLF